MGFSSTTPGIPSRPSGAPTPSTRRPSRFPSFRSPASSESLKKKFGISDDKERLSSTAEAEDAEAPWLRWRGFDTNTPPSESGLDNADSGDQETAAPTIFTGPRNNKDAAGRDEDTDRLVRARSDKGDPLPRPRPKYTHQADKLPPLTDGVPSTGLFSRTRGHYQYRASHMLPFAKLPDKYNTNNTNTNTTANMSDKDAAIEHTESGRGLFAKGGAVTTSSGAPLTRGQKIKRHLKKWWWLHLLIFVCIVVLSVCLIIFVAVPKIAQSRVDGAKLHIDSIQASQTQSTNFTLGINATISADDSIHAVLDPFEGEMYLADWPPQTAFARVSFPSVTSAALTAVNISQFTEIIDLNAFTIFNTYLLTNSTIRVGVRGDTKIRVSGISRKYDVHFDQAVPITALGNFDGITVSNTTVSLTADADGNNFFGSTTIPNRSPLTFEIGNSTFINFMLGQNVGLAYVNDMTLRPGNNTFSLAGNISQTPVLQVIQERPYCETGIIPFELQGQDVTNHGEYLSYYADSLGSTNLSVEIDVMSALNALGLTITCPNTTTKRGESDLEKRVAGRSLNLWDYVV